MRETTESIGSWAEDTFGSATIGRCIDRTHEELEELTIADVTGKGARLIAGEAADVVICLARICHILGYDLFELVDDKMLINRSRQWTRDGTGCGYHVK